MLASTSRFASRNPEGLADLLDLTRGHPLGWLCSTGPNGLMASPLPLMLVESDAGRLLAVEGHFALANPQVAALRADPDALVLWMGVQGYVSPSWMADRTQAPSWNYASAQCRVRVQLDDGDDEAALRHLRTLAEAHEDGRPNAWSVEEMGPRLHRLARHVVSFSAEVVDLQQRYKLGQDERDDVLADIVHGLARSGQHALAGWMQRFNPGRGPLETGFDPAHGDGALVNA